MDVVACPRCASLDVRVPTILDGVWPGGGETNFSVCAGCHYRGSPVLFDGEAEYLGFRRGLQAAADDEMVAAQPARSAAEPAAGQRAMPAFIVIVGILVILATLASAGASLANPSALAADRVSAVAMAIVGLLVGLAFLRIAMRAWRPARA